MPRWFIIRNISLIALAILILVIIPVSAVPTTGAVTEVSNNNATFHASGVTTTGWFMWGMYSGKLYLKTSNLTPDGGSISLRVWDYPIYGSTDYYVKACDVTGCGNEVNFLTLPVTTLPQTTYGAAFTNMTETHFDLAYIPGDVIDPYLNPFKPDLIPLGVTIITGLLLFSVYFGMWFRGKNTAVPSFTGLILSALFMSADSGLNLGVPPEWAGVAQGIFSACLAGIILSIFKKG